MKAKATKPVVPSGDDLAKLREALGWSQERMGEALGFTGKRPEYNARSVRRMEKGEVPISGTIARLMACIRQLKGKVPDWS